MNYWNTFKNYCRKTIWLLDTAFQSFLHDDCYTKASTLTFYTLQSIVPLLAFSIALAKGFGLELFLEKRLTQTFFEQEKILGVAIEFANSMLQQITSGLVIGSGVILLVWSCINLLAYIENAFNSIWKIKTIRNPLQRIKDFLLILIVCPLIFITSSGLAVFLQEGLSHLRPYLYFESLGDYLLIFIKLTSLLLFFSLFFILYILVPNTPIRVWPRVFAAFITAIVFQLWQLIYIHFQVRIFNYSLVYGTFALFPLFLIWMQFSWLITLYGAEIAATIENRIFFDTSKRGKKKINKKQLALLILHHCLKAFYHKAATQTAIRLSQQLKVPLDLTQDILDTLVKKDILTLVYNSDGDHSYIPSADPESFSLKTVIDFIDEAHENNIVVETSEPLIRITKFINNLEKIGEKSDYNISIKELCIK